MAQTSFSSDLTTKTEGQLMHGRLNCDILTKGVDDANGIDLGRMCVATDAAEKLVSLPYSNQAVLTLSAALVASDDVDLTLVVNGTTTALTTTSYASSHAATMAAIETKIEAVDGILSATVAGNVITVLADPETDIHFSVATVTSGGAGTAVASVTNTCTKTFQGPSVAEELAPDSAGNVEFADGTNVGILQKGYIALPTTGTLAPRDSVFIVFHGSNRGKLAPAAGSAPVLAIASSLPTIKEGVTGAGLVVAAFNQP